MPYLDRLARDYVVEQGRNSHRNLSARDFKDKTDRTLTLGKCADGSTLHVYLQMGLLFAYNYVEDRKGARGDCLSGMIAVSDLAPDIYVIPRATDAEFAELMLGYSESLPLIDWDAAENKIEESATGYYGQVWTGFENHKTEESKSVIVDTTPVPWPDEIQDRFAEYSAIAWVPRFLHKEIAHWTEYLADVDNDFRYQEIMILSDGTFSIRFKDQDNYGADSFMASLREQMAEALTDTYRSVLSL